MRGWDLTTGSAKLNLALEALGQAGATVSEHWSDATYRGFQEEYLVPLEPMVKRTLDAIKRLAEELRKAERECGPD